jgi:hypothetical protein
LSHTRAHVGRDVPVAAPENQLIPTSILRIAVLKMDGTACVKTVATQKIKNNLSIL